MHEFQFHRPTSVQQAAEALRSSADAKLLAGGQTLLPTMKQRLAAPKHLIDLSGVGGLATIELKGGSPSIESAPARAWAAGPFSITGSRLEIGALASHAAVAASTTVQDAIPALAELAGGIGDPAVRNVGTLGGSIANNDPAADYPAACLALGATIVTTRREIPADTFFKALFETALEPDEIVVRVSFPVPDRAAYAKFRNRASRYALVGVFVAERRGEVRVAVPGAGENGVFRASALERALAGRFHPDALKGLKVDAKGLVSDIHAAADYRAHLIGVMARRAVEAASGGRA
jgi:carbon-monoxide dehydrogenase medium subunit